MSRDLGALLPPALLRRLEDPPPGLEDVAVPICTVDRDGFPHPAMLTYAELSADGPARLRARVYAGSRTARHLSLDGRATLLFVDEAGAYYVKGRAAGLPTPHPERPHVAVFALDVAMVMEDAVDTSREAAAAIVSGIRFRRTETSS